jgi:MFS family permease
MRNRVALLTALGVDNFGSGLFLPLALVYVTRVVGLPLATAGIIVSAGTLAGLGVPPVAGRFVDRIGPRPVVIAAQVLQALGALTYLAAHGVLAVFAAALLLAAGQQLFYSSLATLIADVAGDGPRDRPFAVANMVRTGCFGLGGLAVAGLLTSAGPVGYRIAVGTDAASFAGCALLLALFVRLPRQRDPARADAVVPPRRLLTDRPFLALIAASGLVVLGADFFLSGTPVYVLEKLHSPPWLPGAILALLTAICGVGGTAALHLTRHLTRIAAMQLGAGLYVVWCAASLTAVILLPGWGPAELLAATVILAASGLVSEPRALALAEATAPPEARGRYMATFQYAFTVAGVIAPALVALYSVAVWLPWLLVGACAALAIPALSLVGPRLPPQAVRPATPA